MTKEMNFPENSIKLTLFGIAFHFTVFQSFINEQHQSHSLKAEAANKRIHPKTSSKYMAFLENEFSDLPAEALLRSIFVNSTGME